jgi:hypothetical protein
MVEIRNPTADRKPLINAKSSTVSIRRPIGSIFFLGFMLDRAQSRLAHRVLTLIEQIIIRY